MLIKDPLDITTYLSTAERFETEFNISQNQAKMPYLIRNVNMFTQDIALTPLEDQQVEFDANHPLHLETLRGNISFQGKVLQVHGKRLLILNVPKQIDFSSTRKNKRFSPPLKKTSGIALEKIEDFSKGVTLKNAHLMDFSQEGLGIRVMDSRCPHLGIGDKIYVRLHPDYNYLKKVQGTVAYKKYVEKRTSHPAFSKVGICLEKSIPVDRVQEVYA